jgi:hypothetical protein
VYWPGIEGGVSAVWRRRLCAWATAPFCFILNYLKFVTCYLPRTWTVYTLTVSLRDAQITAGYEQKPAHFRGQNTRSIHVHPNCTVALLHPTERNASLLNVIFKIFVMCSQTKLTNSIGLIICLLASPCPAVCLSPCSDLRTAKGTFRNYDIGSYH